MRLLLFVGLGYFRDEDSYEFGKASQTIDIETEVQPYMIDDLNDKVTAAVSTVVRFNGTAMMCKYYRIPLY